MKEYMLLFYNVTGKDAYITTPEDMATDMPLWQQWIGNIAMQGKLVSSQPIEYAGTLVGQGGKVTAGPYIQNKQLLTGYLLCRADSQDEVVGWSKTCPILRYPQGVVEVRPVMPFEV